MSLSLLDAAGEVEKMVLVAPASLQPWPGTPGNFFGDPDSGSFGKRIDRI